MEKPRLLVLSCCGESVEKVLTLYYHAKFKSSPGFYDKYNTIMFYGHNLPKRSKESLAHGTIGFYQKYLAHIDFLPCSEEAFLWNKRNQILNKLVYEGIVTGRASENIKANRNKYRDFVSNLPFDVIYPHYMSELISRAKRELDIYKIQPLFLEKNITKILLKINEDKSRYSIYALEPNGKIGTFYFDYKDENELAHWCYELGQKSVLSGNSALLLYQIGLRIGSHTIIGYRKHKIERRPNREYALKKLIQGHKTLLEPKNVVFNDYYTDLDKELTDEERGNIAFARGYSVFLNDCVKNWGLSTHLDVYLDNSDSNP